MPLHLAETSQGNGATWEEQEEEGSNEKDGKKG